MGQMPVAATHEEELGLYMYRGIAALDRWQLCPGAFSICLSNIEPSSTHASNTHCFACSSRDKELARACADTKAALAS